LGVGPVTMPTEFLVLDVDPAYKAILGRPWLEQTQGIPSTAHQCFKFPYNGRVIKIKSVPSIGTLNAITSEQLPSMTVLDKGKRPIMSISELPDPKLTLSIAPDNPPKSKIDSEIKDKGWMVMSRIGYIPGQGLGKDEQGDLLPKKLKIFIGRAGLGFRPDPRFIDFPIPGLRLSWTLTDHFVKGPTQPGTEEDHIQEVEDNEPDPAVQGLEEDFGLLYLFSDPPIHTSIAPSTGTILLSNSPAPAVIIPFHFHPNLPPLLSDRPFNPSPDHLISHSICTFTHSIDVSQKKTPIRKQWSMKCHSKSQAPLSSPHSAKGRLFPT
jgi:G-patch domain